MGCVSRFGGGGTCHRTEGSRYAPAAVSCHHEKVVSSPSATMVLKDLSHLHKGLKRFPPALPISQQTPPNRVGRKSAVSHRHSQLSHTSELWPKR